MSVTAALRSLETRWDWRLSAHCRVGSLASLWLIALLAGPLAWLFAPLAAVRMVLSLAQTLLNVRLGRTSPLESQTAADWLLVAGGFAGAYIAAGVTQFTATPPSAPLLAPMLIPFSILQIRMVSRSHRAALVAELRPATLLRLEDYRRLDRGELRAA